MTRPNHRSLLTLTALTLLTGQTTQAAFYLFAGSADNDSVMRYTDTGANAPSGLNTGAIFVTSGLATLDITQSPTVGPDGNLYVTGYGNGRIRAYSGTTGAHLGGSFGGFWSASDMDGSDDFTVGDGVFLDPAGTEFVGGRGSTFGVDGRLYHTIEGRSNIVRMQGPGQVGEGTVTGGTVWSSGSSLAVIPATGGPTDLHFHPTNGDLYAVGLSNGRVFRFDDGTGAQVGPATNIDGSGFFLTNPFGVAIRDNGHIYVSDIADNTIRVFSGSGNGDLILTIADQGWDVRDIDFGPDGRLYIADRDSDSSGAGRIWVYDPTLGGSPSIFVTDGQGGLDGAIYIDFLEFSETAIPEPATLGLMLAGVALLGRTRRVA